MLTPELALEIKNSGKEVVEMGHAYRVNGVVDVWFNGRTIYNLKTKEYKKATSASEQVQIALEIADKFDKSEPFKKLETGRISYQEFKHKTRDVFPESYHWNNDNETSDDHLYFIQCGLNVKIGRSKDPLSRIVTLKTAMAEKPKILFVANNKGHMEKIMHRCFSEFRREGEWFFYSDRIKNFIRRIKPTA